MHSYLKMLKNLSSL